LNWHIRKTGLLLFVLGSVLGYGSAAPAAETLRPLGQVETVPIGRAGKPYLVIGSEAIIIPLTGPGTITTYLRVAMPTDAATNRKGLLTVGGLGTEDIVFSLDFRPSSSATWPDDRPGKPSAGTKTTLEIPAGDHRIRLTGAAAGGGPLLGVFYYEGPPQPDHPDLLPLKPAVSVGAAAPTRKKSSWSFRGSAGFDIMYNDNILTNSPEDLNDFIIGSYPWKFAHDTNDDLVIAPELRLEARRNLLSWGQSRFTFKFKHWEYTNNPIKRNTDFHFYVRQYFGKSQSLEGYFHFAPEQYIGQLSDRSPLDDPDDDINWTDFRFQRNVWNLTWRQKLTRKISAKVLYEENYRYYNQAFMENDIEAWEVRGNVSYRFNRTYTMNLDYSYEDAHGRGLDEVGEDIINSDNSDPSYKRDLYRVGLTIRHKALRKYLNSIDLSFLFMDYYYTTTKDLVEDPYHAGRRDTYYKGTVDISRKLTKNVTLSAAVRRTERVVYSPWEGDITTDKDFTQWLYWLNLTYGF
jgi:hypothetical protein